VAGRVVFRYIGTKVPGGLRLVTVEDPKALTKPFTVRINQRVMPDDEPLAFVCNENKQFRRRSKDD
jgi:hypothetical protein